MYSSKIHLWFYINEHYRKLQHTFLQEVCPILLRNTFRKSCRLLSKNSLDPRHHRESRISFKNHCTTSPGISKDILFGSAFVISPGFFHELSIDFLKKKIHSSLATFLNTLFERILWGISGVFPEENRTIIPWH